MYKHVIVYSTCSITIWQYYILNITLIASEKTLRSKVVEREEKIKSLQETIISLTSKLKEREIDTSVLEKSTKGTFYIYVIM